MTTAHADWLNEWWSNSNYGGYSPGTYGTSQGKGYATAGSFNVRRQSTTSDYLVSIQRPYIKAGCGGIDGFLGGVGFINDPNYLINKAQNIVSAAPYIAFEMALKILNQQLAGSLQNALSVVDALNNININDCSAGKVMAAALVNPFDPTGQVESAGEAFGKFKMDSGLNDLWTDAKSAMEGNQINNAGDGVTEADLVSGCPTELRNLAQANSALEQLMNRYGYSDTIVEVVRGFFGDFHVTPTQVIPIESCPGNEEGKKLELFWNGQGQRKRLSDGSCVALDISFTENGTNYASIEDWVRTMITEIYDHLANKSAMSEDNRYFIEHIPSPVYLQMKNSVVSGSRDVSIETYTKFCTNGFVFQTINDLYGAVTESIIKAKRISGATNAKSTTCNAISMAPLMEGLSDLQRKLHKFIDMVENEYKTEIQSFHALATNANYVQETNDLIIRRISSAFGSSIATRISK
jgi:conjugative transfer pilus assembly protein TraH